MEAGEPISGKSALAGRQTVLNMCVFLLASNSVEDVLRRYAIVASRTFCGRTGNASLCDKQPLPTHLLHEMI